LGCCSIHAAIPLNFKEPGSVVVSHHLMQALIIGNAEAALFANAESVMKSPVVLSCGLPLC